MRRHEIVDARVGLVGAHRIDREHGVEAAVEAGRRDGGCEHLRRAVGEDGEALALSLQRADELRHLRDSSRAGDRPRAARRAAPVGRREGGEGEVERLLRSAPEVAGSGRRGCAPSCIRAAWRARAPRTAAASGPERLRVPAHGGVHVEQRAVGIESVDGAGHDLAPPPQAACEGVERRRLARQPEV